MRLFSKILLFILSMIITAGETQSFAVLNHSQKEISASLFQSYDYSARQMEPALGRFTTMDPMCESYYDWSPYAYCLGNPIRFVDPEGKQPKKAITYNDLKWWQKGLYKFIEFNEQRGKMLNENMGRENTTINENVTTGLEALTNDILIITGHFEATRGLGVPKAASSADDVARGTRGLSKMGTAVKTTAKATEEFISVYHKGVLKNGMVSSSRSLSVGTEKAAVEALQRPGQVWEFKIPASTLEKWRLDGYAEKMRDLDAVTGVVNDELRFSPILAPELNKYIVK
jgi:RHS repeat-associated protein